MAAHLPDDVIDLIFRWLPIESVARFRKLSKEWNNRLSGQQFLTWRRENFKEHPWILLLPNNGLNCYRLDVLTKTFKVFLRRVHVVLASVGGLLVITNHKRSLFLYNRLTRILTRIPQRANNLQEESVIVCNPARETFYELPLTTLDKGHGRIVGDMLWRHSQYQVVAVHNAAIEVHNFANQSWVVTPMQGAWNGRTGDVVFHKGFYYAVTNFNFNSDWKVIGFFIREDCICQLLDLSLPHTNTCPPLTNPRLVVCASSLALIAQRSHSLYLWELARDHLDIFSDSSWMQVGNMPQEEFTFLFADLDPQTSEDIFVQPLVYKALAAGNYIIFVRDDSGNLVFFNKQNHSWSRFSVDNFRGGFNTYVFEPWPAI
ncbi:hypothetical protein SUGI_0544640 [Cryptomeria japonica]|nr:hypothetical protein SUGI_0544640 [Cryptomeria japonica]